MSIKTFYHIEDDRYLYSYSWEKSKSSPKNGPGKAEGSERPDGKPWDFNWSCRRDPCQLISGDLPRIALGWKYIKPTIDTPLVKLGDVRIRCTVGGKTYWLDEAESIKTLFFSWGTEHKVNLKPNAPVEFDIRASLVENRGISVRVLASADSNTPIDTEIELIYGGMCYPERMQQKIRYMFTTNEDSKNNVLKLIKNGVTITREDIPSKSTVLADPATEIKVTPADPNDPVGNHASFRYKLLLGKKPQTLNLLAFEVESAKQPKLKVEDIEQYHADTVKYYKDLLKPFEIQTPDPVLDASFYTALVNFDYAYCRPAWLEGVHCWSGFLTNNYQISSAISIGQLDRAKEALRFFADCPEGPGSPRNIDGTIMGDSNGLIGGVYRFEEGIPYIIEQLYRYWIATGDDETVGLFWEPLLKSLDRYWEVRDPEGNVLLNYHQGCNAFLYQADHLSLPGDASSPTLMMTDCLEKVAIMADSRKDDATAKLFRHRAEYMRSESVRKLWSSERGKFLACIDDQGLEMEANYYTDYVFPELYTDLPREYSWISLKTLDRTLWVGNHLMRVGDLHPSLFGNDNVMPVQMAEAAEAYAKAGRSDEAYRLLHGVALGSTTYTDSPGNVPERMSDTRLGMSDWVFGNPIGSYIRGMVAGLFGIERAAQNRELIWHPAIPDQWENTVFKIDDISMSISGAHGDRTYTISPGRKQGLDFRIPLHWHKVKKVQDADGNEIPYEIIAHPSGGFLRIYAEPAKKHVIQVVSSAAKAGWELPVKAKSGLSVECNLPASGMSIYDPQKAFEEFRIDGDVLKGRLSKGTGLRTFFLNDAKRESIIPVDVDLGAPKKLPKLSMIPGKREHFDLDGIFNSEVIESRNMWRFMLVAMDMTKNVEKGDILTIDDYKFKVRPSGKNILLVEIGDLDHYTNELKLSDKPHSVKLPIGKAIRGIEFLISSEWKVRLTNMQVGWIKLHYVDGYEQSMPLIDGYNVDSFNQQYATGVVHRELEWLKNLIVVPVEADSSRRVEYAEVSVYSVDGSIGILGANLVL